MSDITVTASINNTDYSLYNDGGTYMDEIVAPGMSENVVVTAMDEAGNTDVKAEYLNVINEWLPPKTDWTAEDYFNAVDYNRIIGNIAYLRNFLDSLFLDISYINLGVEKDYRSLLYAREMNVIEQAIQRLNLETYALDIGAEKSYSPNKPTPMYSDFNRIESASLLIYNTMIAHKKSLPRMAFRLGNRKGIKV